MWYNKPSVRPLEPNLHVNTVAHSTETEACNLWLSCSTCVSWECLEAAAAVAVTQTSTCKCNKQVQHTSWYIDKLYRQTIQGKTAVTGLNFCQAAAANADLCFMVSSWSSSRHPFLWSDFNKFLWEVPLRVELPEGGTTPRHTYSRRLYSAFSQLNQWLWRVPGWVFEITMDARFWCKSLHSLLFLSYLSLTGAKSNSISIPNFRKVRKRLWAGRLR